MTPNAARSHGIASSLHTLATAFALAVTLGCQTAHRPPAPAADVAAEAAVSADAYAGRLLELVNHERGRHGLQPLRRTRCAEELAGPWSHRLARRDALQHRPIRDLLRACDARRAAENLGAGQPTPDALLRSWLASARHRANLLNPTLTHVGLGVARSERGSWYAVAHFVAF
jgi:uncharacterized protein YkwD